MLFKIIIVAYSKNNGKPINIVGKTQIKPIKQIFKESVFMHALCGRYV
jgi:hypothetical protein